MYSPSAAGLPEDYAVDLGTNPYGKDPHPRIRGDLVEFALAVREVDPARADQLNWQLQTIPAAVCLAGPRVRGGFDGFVTRVEERVAAVAAVAAQFGVTPPSAPTASNDPVLRAAVRLAEDMFCPDHGKAVGDPEGVLPGWDPEADGYFDFDDGAIPIWAQFNPWLTNKVRRFEAAAIYLVVAASPALAGWSAIDVAAAAELCPERDRFVEHSDPLTRDNWTADAAPTTADLQATLGTNIAYLAVVELACPPDWVEL